MKDILVTIGLAVIFAVVAAQLWGNWEEVKSAKKIDKGFFVITAIFAACDAFLGNLTFCAFWGAYMAFLLALEVRRRRLLDVADELDMLRNAFKPPAASRAFIAAKVETIADKARRGAK